MSHVPAAPAAPEPQTRIVGGWIITDGWPFGEAEKPGGPVDIGFTATHMLTGAEITWRGCGFWTFDTLAQQHPDRLLLRQPGPARPLSGPLNSITARTQLLRIIEGT